MSDPLNSAGFLTLLSGAQQQLDAGFAHLPESPAAPLPPEAAAVLAEAATRMFDNYPYSHPLYAGQMLKPPHPVARAAYAMAMAVNPNNHALDGGRASSAMELEAVAEIAAMFGMPRHLGHLTSSGTIANLEALWIAGQLHPGKAVAASSQAHYTHTRISGVLGLPFVAIPVDESNRISLPALEHLLQTQDIGTVVATLGTTATGSVDPLDGILVLQKKYGFRIHVDGAYGGYFTLASNLEPAARHAYDSIAQADSVVIDPHKHGLQPYGCGCVLFRDPAIGRYYKHDSPFTYFTSGALHLGEISLECSRAGASAVALWSTQRLLPLTHGGSFARGLAQGREAALEFYDRIAKSSEFFAPALSPQLDIVFFAAAAATPDLSSALAQSIFDEAAKLGLHLALARLSTALFPLGTWSGNIQIASESGPAPTVLCLRSVLMKPEHLHYHRKVKSLTPSIRVLPRK
jgi:glutamate/tyrosine decarboxylase-like PLP-dependent enzyme